MLQHKYNKIGHHAVEDMLKLLHVEGRRCWERWDHGQLSSQGKNKSHYACFLPSTTPRTSPLPSPCEGGVRNELEVDTGSM